MCATFPPCSRSLSSFCPIHGDSVEPMRVPIVVMILILIPVAGCMEGGSSSRNGGPPESSEIPGTGWIELHLNWTRGGQFLWNNTSYRASENEEWATDGSSYLYGRPANASVDHERCVREDPPDPGATPVGPYVFMASSETGCVWQRHPSYYCFRTSFCEQQTFSAGPGPRPTSA